MSDQLIEELDEQLEQAYEKSKEISKLEDENKELNAKVRNVKLKRQASDLQKAVETTERIKQENILDRKADIESMQQDVEDRKRAITFIDTDLSKQIILAPHSLSIFCAMTGHGKSTLVAAVATPLINEGKRVLILSNEEIDNDVRARVSCLRVGVSFGAYKSNRCTQDQVDMVKNDAKSIEHLLIVISNKNDDDTYRTTDINGIIETLKSVNGHIDLGILDYYQNANEEAGGMTEPWHNNNKLASNLNTLKNSLSFPLAVFAQCKSMDNKEKKDEDFEASHPVYRWIGGTKILIYATDIIELARDFNNSRSRLYIHKRRFQDGEFKPVHTLGFDKKMQRFVKYTPEFDANIGMEKVLEKQAERDKDRLKKLGLGASE